MSRFNHRAFQDQLLLTPLTSSTPCPRSPTRHHPAMYSPSPAHPLHHSLHQFPRSPPAPRPRSDSSHEPHHHPPTPRRPAPRSRQASPPPQVRPPSLRRPPSPKWAQTNSSPQPHLPSAGQRARKEIPAAAWTEPSATAREQAQGTRQSRRRWCWQPTEEGVEAGSRPCQRLRCRDVWAAERVSPVHPSSLRLPSSTKWAQTSWCSQTRLPLAGQRAREEIPAAAWNVPSATGWNEPSATACEQRQGTRQSPRRCWPGRKREVVSRPSQHLQRRAHFRPGRALPADETESHWEYWTERWATAWRQRGLRERHQP